MFYSKEEIKKAITNIVNLSNEDPEDIYVAKWQIEKKIKEKNPSYQKKTLQEFISDLGIGETIYIYNTNTMVPFSIFYNYMFVAIDNNEDIEKLLKSLSDIEYDFNNLKLYSNMNIVNNIPYGPTYFLIDGNIMVNDKLNN